MKYAFTLLVLLFGLVASELCYRDGRSCAQEECTGNQVPTCINYVCTCTDPPPDNSCVTKSDCDQKNYWDSHHCSNDRRHCYDSECQCKRLYSG